MSKDSAADGPGPENHLFEATRWSVVQRARDKSEGALGILCESYRRPLLIWLRSRGYSQHDAEDLVQGYFAHLLNRDFLANVAREKGAFRTFLLRCLKNFIRDQVDRNKAAKRGGGAAIESLDVTTEDGQKVHDPAAHQSAPDVEYDRAWAQAVLEHALKRLREECSRSGHGALCAELEPVMFADEAAAPYAEIAARLGMTPGAVTTAAHRIRLRLKGLIRDEVSQTVSNDEDWRHELNYLIQLFGR